MKTKTREGGHRCPGILELLVLSVLLTACAGEDLDQAATDEASIVIRNAHVVDVENGVLLENHTVTIRDGRIARVEPDREVGDPPTGAMVIDATDRYLIPGLWDMHVHFRGGEELVEENRALLPLYIANGVTTVRDAGGDITEDILQWRLQIDEGRQVGPRILTSGPKLDGPTGGWDGSIRLSSPDEVPSAIDALEDMGVDYVKIYDGTLGGDVYLAILEETERRGLVVTGHMPMTVGFRDAVSKGLDGTEHLYYAFKGSAANEDSVTAAVLSRQGTSEAMGFRQTLNLLRAGFDDGTARETYRLMAERGTVAIPTLHIGAVLAVVDSTDHSMDPELQYIHPNIEATYARRVEGARRASPEARAERLDLQEVFIRMARQMHQSGVTLLAGSDAGPFNSFVYPGFSLHSELEWLVRVGLTPAEALRAATQLPAEFMRRGHEFGQVREGFRADLVLLDANPLQDIGNTRRIETVFVGGERVFQRTDLDALLAAARR